MSETKIGDGLATWLVTGIAVGTVATGLVYAGLSHSTLPPEQIARLSPADLVDYKLAGGRGLSGIYEGNCLSGTDYDPHRPRSRFLHLGSIVTRGADGIFTVAPTNPNAAAPIHLTWDGQFHPADAFSQRILDQNNCGTGPVALS